MTLVRWTKWNGGHGGMVWQIFGQPI